MKTNLSLLLLILTLTISCVKNESLKTIDLVKYEYMPGLWVPDADESIQMDSRYAVRVANNDSPWWTTLRMVNMV